MHGLSIYFVMGNSARRFLDLHLNADSSSRQRFTPIVIGSCAIALTAFALQPPRPVCVIGPGAHGARADLDNADLMASHLAVRGL